MKLKDNKDVLYGSLLITKITPIQKKWRKSTNLEEIQKPEKIQKIENWMEIQTN